ncbi:MAG: ATP phosphoribosyltransferase [Bacteroidetes bacterium]|jgi:ATP phosphoribosyltransferase|nr:ATP phosphoribosyltransferase [Bacteroidota bacterium]
MEKIRLAIQKSGRLSEKSLELIKECGVSYASGTGKLLANCYNFPMEILFLRDDDIPGYVEDGVADIGIVGENVLVESNKKVKTIDKLGFGRCRLSIAVARTMSYNDIQDLNGKSIATSYPIILGKFLKEKGVKAEIHEISGSVEIAPGIGLAEGICDLVSTGSTLLSNGLKEVETIFNSEAVLISHKGISAEKQMTIDKLLFRLNSVKKAKNTKYILLNAPNASIAEIIDILPGINSPTVQPLAKVGWSSLHSVLNADDFWEKIEALKKAGAEGILVMPIENLIA